MIASNISIVILTLGGLSIKKSSPFLDTSIEGCTNETFSNYIPKLEKSFWKSSYESSDEFSSPSEAPFPTNIFLISYMYYVVIGTLITVILGIFVSLITRSKEDAYDSKLIHPGVYKLTTYLPCCDKLFVKPRTPTEDLQCENFVGEGSGDVAAVNEKFV